MLENKNEIVYYDTFCPKDDNDGIIGNIINLDDDLVNEIKFTDCDSFEIYSNGINSDEEIIS